MQVLWRQAKASLGLRQSILSVVGNTAASMLSGVAMILLSRVLGPTVFGEFNVGFSLSLVLINFYAGGLNPLILRYGSAFASKEALEVFRYTLQLKLIFSAVLIIAGVVGVPAFSRASNFPDLAILYVAVIGTLGVVWYEHLLLMFQSLHKFGTAVLMAVSQAGLKLALTVGLLLAHKAAALPALVTYMAAPALVATVSLRWAPALKNWQPFTRTGFATGHKYLGQTAAHISIGTVVVGMIDHIDILLVRRFLDAHETGLLSGVSKLALLLMLAAYAMGSVLYPRVAKYAHSHHLDIYLKKAWVIAGLAGIGFLVTYFLAPLLIQLSIGDQYAGAEVALQWLLGAAWLTVALVPFQAIFYAVDYPWYYSVTGILQLLIVVFGNLLFVPAGGIVASAFIKFLSRLLLFIISVALGTYAVRQKQTSAQK